MATPNIVKVGRLLKPHGLQGEIKVVFEDYTEESIVENGILFIKEAGSFVPYKIKQVRGGGSAIMILFGINDRTAATRLSNKSIFADANKIEAAEPDELEYEFLKGFDLIDKTFGSVGSIEDVLEYPQQEMALIQFQGSDILIPLNESFIQTIDQDKQTVLVQLPEGLLDLYTS